MATALTNCRLSEVDSELARLRAEAASERPSMRTSVMTHIAWVPEPWLDAARSALAGMHERHPSRTVLLVPEPGAEDGIDATVSVEAYDVPGSDRRIVSEVIELRLRGARSSAPASVVEPLLISDLPVFLRWRGEPDWDSQELDQLVTIVDRLVVDSTEWDDLRASYARLAELFERAVVSDIAWERTSRWRRLLATLWPGIAEVKQLRVTGTEAQALLLCGWLRSRLQRHDIEVEHVEAERLTAVELDGESAPFPPGDPPSPSDVLSEELDQFTRDRVYEAAVIAAT